MQKKIKQGDLAWCGGQLVTIVELNGEWATVRPFGGPQCDRLLKTLEVLK